MVLQVLDLVSTTSEPFYGDCPAQTYTDLDINASGHTTCTVVPQGGYGQLRSPACPPTEEIRDEGSPPPGPPPGLFHVQRSPTYHHIKESYKSSCPPSETGNYGGGIETLQSLTSEEQAQFLACNPHYADDHEYQSLDHQPQAYLESSPEFYPGNNLLETKYHPHGYMKNYPRGAGRYNEGYSEAYLNTFENIPTDI
ncbi:Ets-domain [Popillia japonica]|uniref:Ets-domain n=1 Tax=Popillia japonica TaxID=7064 RepID=A0AAW1HU30_POPJA